MERRGLTLMELLVAAALLAVIGAITLPAVQARLAGARFEAAGRELESAIVMARAEAQRTGRVVSLVARATASGETGLYVEQAPGGRGAAGVGAEERRPDAGRAAPWAVAGAGVALSDVPPDGPGAPERAQSRERGARSAPELVIARFMPDGTAAAAGPVYLTSKAEGAAYTVNRWTGSATVRAVSRAVGEEEETPALGSGVDESAATRGRP